MARPDKKSGQKYWSGRGGGKAGQGGGEKDARGKDKPQAGTGDHTVRPGSLSPKVPRSDKTRELPSARTPRCRDLLGKGMAELGLDAALGGGIDLYLKEMELWNPRLGLVEAGGEDLVVKHILDSLSICRPLQELMAFRGESSVTRIADLGSGGGFPALPLALFLKGAQAKNWSMDLYDKQARRTVFLRNCVAILGLKGLVEVHQAVLEGMDHQIGRDAATAIPGSAGLPAGSRGTAGMDGPIMEGGSPPARDQIGNGGGAAGEAEFEGASRPGQNFHLITARAFRPLDGEILAAMRRMLVPGGWICLMKARKDSVKEELTRVRSEMHMISSVSELPAQALAGEGKAWVLPLHVPGLGEERHLVFIPA